MPGPVLYSTNPYFSIDVAQRYRRNKYYAWCSEVFSYQQQHINALGSSVAASSDPETIYTQLSSAVDGEDIHDARIKGYKRKFKQLAETWFSQDEITKDQRDEIKTLCARASWQMWRPRLFIIPRKSIEDAGRLHPVKARNRAGLGSEFTAELEEGEFDIVRLPNIGRLK